MITSQYPMSLTMGERGYATVYRLQTDQLLLWFAQGLEDPRIDTLLQTYGVFPIERPDGVPGGGHLPPGMRWVHVGQQGIALSEFARNLLKESPQQLKMAGPVYFADGQGPGSAVASMPRCLIIRFRRGMEEEGTARLAREHELVYDETGSRWLGQFRRFWQAPGRAGGYAGEPTESFRLLEAVSQATEVDVAELSWLRLQALAHDPDDPLFDDPEVEWGGQWNMRQIGMPAAWDEQTGDSGLVIAVIDTGFDLGHPDIAYAAVESHFNALSEFEGDPLPYDASPDPDAHGSSKAHGTAVAGLAAATLNTEGIAGVAGGCRILPIRCSSEGVVWSDGFTASVNWAVEHGARVIAMSINSVPMVHCTVALSTAWDAGVVLVASAGNYSREPPPNIDYPAAAVQVIAVGATDESDRRVLPATSGEDWGSRPGRQLDVMAPGIHLWSTDIAGTDGFGTDAYTARMNGTSGACPHVAGLAALLMLRHPEITKQQMRDSIERTCEKVGGYDYEFVEDSVYPRNNGSWNEDMGYGRINAAAALRYADLMIADHPEDDGTEPSCRREAGAWEPNNFWEYQPFVTVDSQPNAAPGDHEPPEPGGERDHYLHAVVVNRGPAQATGIEVRWHLTDYPGSEFHWPTDWNDLNQVASTRIDTLPAGDAVPVEALWPAASVELASDYIHPCILVQVRSDQDPYPVDGPDCYVYQYNNIAQRNLVFAAHKRLRMGRYVLPFAVGHQLSISRQATLYFDLRWALGATVLLDLDPGPELPYVERIRKAARRSAHSQPENARCGVRLLEDTRLALDCCGCRAEAEIKAGSTLRLMCNDNLNRLDPVQLLLDQAAPIVDEGRTRLLLSGPRARVGFPLHRGQIVPVAFYLVLPDGAMPGSRFRVDVTQVGDTGPTGGVSLEVEA